MARLRYALMTAAMIAAPMIAGTANAASNGGPTGDLKLERMVMLMRHSVRPPTKSPATPEGTTAQPWSTWTTPFGELTPHGAEGARLMGVYSRTFAGPDPA